MEGEENVGENVRDEQDAERSLCGDDGSPQGEGGELSRIPTECLSGPCVLGVDEAGRGPVLGPMVYAACFCPLTCKENLEELKVADSKALSEKQRDEIFQRLHTTPFIGYLVQALSPNYISNCMQRRHKYNLNALSHDTAIGLIQRALDGGVQLAEVYVDTVGMAQRYEERLRAVFPGIEITVRAKADALFPIVSAASICAKVTRDAMLKGWKFVEAFDNPDADYGSGYPNDPKTRVWLTRCMNPVFGYPRLVRFSWSTVKTALQDSIPVTWEHENEEEEGSTNNGKTSLLPFLNRTSPARHNPLPLPLHRYFKERNLCQVLTL
uniref:ribonuclease H2 subunit A n=1 Tax=Myxine glutinosa TaxID=7769 RepID=UPI00358FCEC8